MGWRAYIIWFCIAVSGTSHAAAQSNFYEEEPKAFTGGFVLGPNFTQVDGDTYYGYHKIGLTAGGTVYAHFDQTFGVSLELIYSQKGSRGEAITQSPTVGTYVAKYFMNLNYVEVPLTIHAVYKTIDFEAGLSYSRLVRSGEWIQSDYAVVIDPVRNAFNTTDWEYILGVRRKLYKNLHASVRFQYSVFSIRPMDRVPADYGYGSAGQWNNMFSFRLMYIL